MWDQDCHKAGDVGIDALEEVRDFGQDDRLTLGERYQLFEELDLLALVAAHDAEAIGSCADPVASDAVLAPADA